jgi:hypothetical protein
MRRRQFARHPEIRSADAATLGLARAVFERTAESQSSSPAATAGSGVAAGKVKVVIAGTNDRIPPPTDGSLAGKGTFRAGGAITDAGTALAYRTVRADVITLRFVAKGKKGTITYVVKIDTNAGTSRWTIASGTKAYNGLHGKGTETENASYTISTLRGTMSR